MASLKLDRGGHYHIQFRWEGKAYTRSIYEKDKDKATLIKLEAEQTIALLKGGHISMLDNADPGIFIATGGRLCQKYKS
jgi:hypothetical protein